MAHTISQTRRISRQNRLIFEDRSIYLRCLACTHTLHVEWDIAYRFLSSCLEKATSHMSQICTHSWSSYVHLCLKTWCQYLLEARSWYYHISLRNSSTTTCYCRVQNFTYCLRAFHLQDYQAVWQIIAPSGWRITCRTKNAQLKMQQLSVFMTLVFLVVENKSQFLCFRWKM